jgi:signal transduction histidine kinase
VQARWALVTVEAGLAAGLAATLAVEATAIAHTWGGSYWQFDCVAAVLAAVPVLLRRRHRAAAAAAGLGVGAAAILIARFGGLPAEPGPAVALALAVLIGSAVRALAAPVAGGLAAAGLAVAAGSWLAHPSSGGIRAVTAINLLGWFGGVATGLGLRLLDERRRAAVEAVRRDERLALARELHDVVAHHITGIVLQAQGGRIAARKEPGTADAALAGIETAGADALAAMRRVIGILRDADDAAPATAGPERLGELVRRFGSHGPAVRLRLPDQPTPWPPEVTSTVFRVVQESLTNVARHAAHARAVEVTVGQDRDGVTVEVLDDGQPGPGRHPARGGFGLIGMRERVETLGGTLTAGPRAGTGWSVRVSLPVPGPVAPGSP